MSKEHKNIKNVNIISMYKNKSGGLKKKDSRYGIYYQIRIQIKQYRTIGTDLFSNKSKTYNTVCLRISSYMKLVKTSWTYSLTLQNKCMRRLMYTFG